MRGLRMEDFYKIYDAIVNVRPLDERYCKVYDAILNFRPLDGKCLQNLLGNCKCEAFVSKSLQNI